MASRHLFSYVLFGLAALVIVLSLTSLALQGTLGPIVALALLLAGFLLYRQGR